MQQECKETKSYDAKIFNLPWYEGPRAGFLCPHCDRYHWHSIESGHRSGCGHCQNTARDEDYYLNVLGEATSEDLDKFREWDIRKRKEVISEWFWPLVSPGEDTQARKDALAYADELLHLLCDEHKLDYDTTRHEILKLVENDLFLQQFNHQDSDEDYERWKTAFNKFHDENPGFETVLEERPMVERKSDEEQKEEALKQLKENMEQEKDKIDEWLQLTEEELEKLDEDNIKEQYREYQKDPSKLKVVPLHLIEIFGNKIVKTRVRVESIEKGANVLKGVEVECPSCGEKATIYNPYIRKAEDFCGCMDIGPRGGPKALPLKRKSVNDTGYFCEVIDPNEKSSTTPERIFISLKKLPRTSKEIEELDRLMQTNEMEVVGTLRVKKGKEVNVSDWFIDVEEFKFIKQQYEYDIKQIKELDGIERDDEFFKKYYVSEVYDSILRKKILALAICNPVEICFPNGMVRNSFVKALIMGDPGVAKTVLAKKGFVEYSEGRSAFYSVENATSKGLLMKTIQGKSGRWIVSMGEIPKYHKGGVVLDGIGKLDQAGQSELRGVKEEGIAQSVKASGNAKLPSQTHIISLGNIKRPVSEYPSKHAASRDLAINHQDMSGKFEGADRRREDFVVVVSNQDSDTNDVQRELLTQVKKEGFDDKKYWNNVNAFAWSREPQSIEWEEGVVDEILSRLTKLNMDYKNFEKDYGILQKSGAHIFTKLLPGVAVLHGSIEDEKIMVKKKHCKWLYELYEEMFRDLGLAFENDKENFLDVHAQMIYYRSTPRQKEVLYLLSTYGSQGAIEKAGLMARKTIYNKLKDVIMYYVNEDGKEVNKYYSLNDGSVKKKYNSESGMDEYEQDFELDGLQKSDGSYTKLGQKLLMEAKKNYSNVKKIEEVEKNEE